MNDGDGHIHVDASAPRGDGATARDILAATFGLAGDAPTVVATGCGLRVPYAMTSARPESVTCLPCREHARDQHLRFAEQVEQLSGMLGTAIQPAEAARAAARHRELARKFGSD